MSDFKTQLVKYNDVYGGMIEKSLEERNIKLSEYGKVCVINAISAINELVSNEGLNMSSPVIDSATLTTALMTVATLELNAKATNREIYFILRNKSRKGADGKTEWVKQIELNLEGDAFDHLVAMFGRNVKTVCPYWVVREDDEFIYPRMRGLEMTPPEWQAKGTGKIVRVVYPIIGNDDIVNFYIAERADIAANLRAHIRNNMMNETFGICADRYKATDEQKKQIADKKKAIMDKISGLDIEQILDTEEARPFISDAWSDSTEAMILRKLRNNICKKIPKDFSKNFAVQELYERATDPIYAEAVEIREEEANAIPLDMPRPTTGEDKPNF